VPVPVLGSGVAVPAGDEDVLVDRDVVVVAREVVVVDVVTRVDDDDEAEVLLEVVVEGVPGTHWK
jgi:hypothetical protein